MISTHNSSKLTKARCNLTPVSINDPLTSLVDKNPSSLELMKLTNSTEFPVFSLDAVLHKDLASATKLFSIHDMEYYLWVRIDPLIAQNYSFYEFDEVDSVKKYDINMQDFCSHEENRIWFRFNSMVLNRDPGQHVYRMHMVNRQNETTISLYFSYIVQREDVKKPYKYLPQHIQEQERAMKI